MECPEDEFDYSDDDDDDFSGRQFLSAAGTPSSGDTSLLHRNRRSYRLPATLDGLTDPPDLRDNAHADRSDSYPSSTSPSSERNLYYHQPFIFADGTQGVDNGLDATTYF